MPWYLRDLDAGKVLAARERAGISQAQAAHAVHLGSRPRWAEYELGKHSIDPARFELFLLITGQHPEYELKRRAVASV